MIVLGSENFSGSLLIMRTPTEEEVTVFLELVLPRIPRMYKNPVELSDKCSP